MKRKDSQSLSNIKETKSHGFDQWKALITSFLMQSLTLGTLESFGALYIPIMDSLLKDDSKKSSKAALIGSLTSGFLMGFSPVSSMLIDKVGAQLIALLGGVIVFMATLISSFVNSFYLMALFYGVIFGIGCSMLFISSNVVISMYFQENSTVAYGILGLGNGLMNSIMPHVISYCVDSIKLGGTIRIICFLLSFIMFFPLYWSSYSYDITEDQVVRYVPSRIFSRKNLSEDDQLEDFRNIKISRNFKDKNLKISTPEQINVSNIKRKLLLNVKKSLSSMKKENYYWSNKSNNTVDNEGLPSIFKMERIPENKIFQRLSSKSTHPSHPDNNLVDIGTAPSSSIGEFYNKFYTEMSTGSPRTRDQFLKSFKNMKFLQAEVFQNQAYVILLFGMFIAMFGYQVPNVHIVKFAQEIAPLNNGQVLLTCLGASSALGPFINGIIMDRFHCRISKYRLYQFFVLSYGIVLLTLTITTKYSIIIVICIAIGYLDGSFTSLIGPLSIDLVGVSQAGKAIGIFYGVIAPAVMVAPPLAGVIYESFASYKYAFFGAGLFFLTGGLVLSISYTGSKTNTIAKERKADFVTNTFTATDLIFSESVNIEDQANRQTINN